MTIRPSRSRVLVTGIAVALIAVLASNASGSTQPSSAGPQKTQRQDFLKSLSDSRATAVQQASGCPDASCRAFQPSSQSSNNKQPAYARDHVIATFDAGVVTAPAARTLGSRVIERVGRTNTAIVSVPAGTNTKAFLNKLRADKNVAHADLDYGVRSFSSTQTTAWGVRAIKAPAAHTSNSATGSGVTVAIVDTGVDYTHPDLKNNIKINSAEDGNANGAFDPHDPLDNDGVDNGANGFVDDVSGYDFIGTSASSIQPDNDPMDIYGHGTHVAGIVAAEDNGFGVVGVAPAAKILPVRVLDDQGFGWDSTVANGIYYAVDNGANIINMSLGSYGDSSTLRGAVDYAAAHNVAVVAAAGNSTLYSLPLFPAGYPSVVSVAAARDVDPSSDTEPLQKIWWSNWGTTHVLAPGVDVLSTTPANTYSTFSGTSMASPHVAGAMALVWQKMVSSAISPTPAKVEQAIAASATDVYFPGIDEVSGFGVPDTLAATTITPAVHQVELYRNGYQILSDGVSASTLTLRVLDGNGSPIAAEPVSWGTDKGTLSGLGLVTDVNGEATATLTAASGYGSATVTATPATDSARSVRVIVNDDRIRVDDAYVMTQSFGDPFPFAGKVTVTPDPTPTDGGGGTEISPQPGEDVIFRAYLGSHAPDFDPHKVSVTWTVTDPSSATVADLSGQLDPVTVFGFGDQRGFDSEPMTIPFDAVPGRYHLNVVATTIGNGKTHTFNKDFFVGVQNADVLIVNSRVSLNTETLNYGFAQQSDSAVRRAVEASGHTFTIWDQNAMGTSPPADVLFAHPVVIWLGGLLGDDLDLDAVSSYISAGGNLIVSGEQFASVARGSGSNQYRNTLNASGLLKSFFPDDNDEQNPGSVNFDTPSDPSLAPLSGGFNLGQYDLNHTGESTALFTDELKLYTGNGATRLATYPRGIDAPGGFEAGTVNDDGNARVINLGFGLESIDDTGSHASLATTIDTILGFFLPAPSIAGVSKPRVANTGKDGFYIDGDNFQPTGHTVVKLGSLEIPQAQVLSRTTIFVRIPKGFPKGHYDVTVTNPDGQTVTDVGAITVVKPRKKK